MGLNISIKTSTEEGGGGRPIVWLQHHIHITLSATTLTVLAFSSSSSPFFNVCVVAFQLKHRNKKQLAPRPFCCRVDRAVTNPRVHSQMRRHWLTAGECRRSCRDIRRRHMRSEFQLSLFFSQHSYLLSASTSKWWLIYGEVGKQMNHHQAVEYKRRSENEDDFTWCQFEIEEKIK